VTRYSSGIRTAVYKKPNISELLVPRVLVGRCFASSYRLVVPG
jgi:hypothetical protein